MAEFLNIKTSSVNKNVPVKEAFDIAQPISYNLTLYAKDWNPTTKKQTVTVNGVSKHEITQKIIIAPKIVDMIGYYNLGVIASDQQDNILVFSCDRLPTIDLDITVIVKNIYPSPLIYGVSWLVKPSPKLTRIDDAADFSDPQPAIAGGTGSSPFDDILPWSGMIRVTHETVGEVVAIPKFYYKWIQEDPAKDIKLQISMFPHKGFYCSPAHMDRGDGKGERDVVYVGRYHANVYGQSVSGATRYAYGNTLTQNRKLANKVGSHIMDMATRMTIQMLYLVEFANWDAQAVLGWGGGNNSSREATGLTDSMQYHTGTMQEKIAMSGAGIQYRHIEGLWETMTEMLDGCYQGSDKSLYVTLNPNNYADRTKYTLVGTDLVSAYPKYLTVSKVKNYNWALYNTSPSTGNWALYICDYQSYNTTQPMLSYGSSYVMSRNRGMFNIMSSVDDSIWVGYRSVILP